MHREPPRNVDFLVGFEREGGIEFVRPKKALKNNAKKCSNAFQLTYQEKTMAKMATPPQTASRIRSVVVIFMIIAVIPSHDWGVTTTISALSSTSRAAKTKRRPAKKQRYSNPVSSIESKAKPRSNSDNNKNNIPKTSESSSSLKTVSLGQRVQDVRSIDDVLHVASDFWLPSDEDLPTYYYNQAVHNDSRRRWASQLLGKLELLSATASTASSDTTHILREVLDDPRLTRLILAAALPQVKDDNQSNAVKTKCNNWMLDSLMAIYAIVGRASTQTTIRLNSNAATSTTTTPGSHNHRQLVLPIETAEAVQTVIDYCLLHSNEYSLEKACQILFTVRGIRTRISNFDKLDQRLPASLVDSEYHLSERVAGLPFDIVPLGVNWSDVVRTSALEDASRQSLSASSVLTITDLLIDSIPFQKDAIVTRKGTTVQERRGTAWVAEDGIGALAYSGKLMVPHSPLPNVVKTAMTQVEDRLGLQNVAPSGFFDCALCNHYADKDAACKYHTDPEHGTLWDKTTVVVAAGSDRKFSFKPIESSWQEWDSKNLDAPAESATMHVFSGDVIVMTDSCNDDFYHAVHAGSCDDDRVSLVLKRALDRNGRKGHGLPGEGRRSGRNKNRRR